MSELKKNALDFIFIDLIGEGSFSMVYSARSKAKESEEFAIKVCEKKLIRREKKSQAVLREKKCLQVLTSHPSPFFIKLYCTFQDENRLFFVMNYAKSGELLQLINERQIFDLNCCRFYSAEIILALEHLHRLGIVHRDLKPENILLNEKMHIQVTDFGSALILNDTTTELTLQSPEEPLHTRRKNSFVGTAHYVSPEMLTNKSATASSDLWAFACIVYQMISGSAPFRAPNEYLIFQKIIGLEYEFSKEFTECSEMLIKNILRINPTERLGANDDLNAKGYTSIKSDPFFAPLASKWSLIHEMIPPVSDSYTKNAKNDEMKKKSTVTENLEPGLAEKQITRIMGLALHEDFDKNHSSAKKGILDISPQEMSERLESQRENNIFHRFVENNLILKQGFIDKKKGLFARRRMFLLATGPHLYYVDASNMVLKGQVPWSKDMRPEAKNFKTFYIHTPNRTYFLEDPSGEAPEWCRVVEEVRQTTFGNSSQHISDSTPNICNTNVSIRKISLNDRKLR